MPMPGLRSLKGIGRRKSATPGLDDSSTSPTTTSSGSTFRVIPRQEIVRKSIGSSVEKPLPAVLDYSRTWSEEDSNSSNRGSGSSATTANSRGYDRPTVISTSPSPTSIDLSKPSNRLSTLSISNPNATSRTRYAQRPVSKTPSKSFLDLPTESDQEDFGSMFNGLGDTKSQATAENSLTLPPPPVLRADSEPMLSAEAPWQYRATKTPPPMAFRRHADLEPSPPSVNSKTSRDGLLSSPASSHSPYRDEVPVPPLHRSPLSKLADTVDGLRLTENGKFNSNSSSPLRRSESIESFSRSGENEDADAKMVRNSVIAMRQTTGRSPDRTGSPVSRGQKSSASNSLHPPLDSSTSSETSFKTPSSSSNGSTSDGYSTMGLEKKHEEEFVKSDVATSASTTPRQGIFKVPKDDDDDEPLGNLPIGQSAVKRLSFLPPSPSRPAEAIPLGPYYASQEPQNSKRMSTFDKVGVLNTSQSSSVESIEEKEKRESPTKQTRKDAQEIIFRQQLTKDIGDHTSTLPPRPLPKGSQSAPNLLSLNSLPTVSEAGSKSGSDDDDDIPLAVLQAHNFPNRTKTPDPRLSQNSFIGTSARPHSTFGGGSMMNNRTSLPPFARKLPQDPYGSTPNLLNATASRESLLLNRSSFYPPPGQSPVPGLPPGGLVGVIAEEEKMKSIRRSGADVGKSQLPPMGLNPGMSMGMNGLNIPGLGPGMGGPNMQMMPMAAMQDQGQINQQLLQVVQQQTVMLQAMYSQMQAQMGMNMSPVMDQNGFLQPPQQVPGSPRPMSMVSGVSRPGNPRTRSMVNLSRPPNAPRTMSMINTSSPFAQNWNIPHEPLINSAGSVRGLGFDGGYAHSVAASERSNIGQPSRYRPVTNSHFAETGSTITSLAPQPPQHDNDMSRKKKSGFFSAIMHPKGRGNDVGGDEEEEEDWSNFAKKRRSAIPSSFR